MRITACGRQKTKDVSEHAFPILNPYALGSRFSVPCLPLVGENEKIYSAQSAVRRLNRIAPQVNADLVISKVLAFLDEPVGAAPAA